MTGFAWSRGICVLCLVLLCQSPGRAADADPDVEKQLLKAIAEGDLAEVENLAAGLDLSKITNFYYHVLNSPNAEVVDFLREQEDLSISDLQVLAIRGDAKAVKRFLDSLDKKTRTRELQKGEGSPFSSHSPLMLAVRNGRTKAARALIEAGANVNEESRYSLTPLACAAERGQAEVVKDLLKAGAKINAAPDGKTALMMACWGKQPRVVELLLKAKADPHRNRHDGQTALHFAAKKGDAKCINLLLEHGVDPNALAYGKDTPLHYAEIYEHKAAAQRLRQATAKSRMK